MYPQVRNAVKSGSNRHDQLGRWRPPNGQPSDAVANGGALSRLNPLGSTAGNRLIFLGRDLSKTD